MIMGVPIRQIFRLATSVIIVFAVSGCNRPGTCQEEFKARFKVALPPHLHFVNYAAGHAMMDSKYIWEISPIDDEYLKDLHQITKLIRLKTNDPSNSTLGLLSSNWPHWWDQYYIYELSEVYGRRDDENGRKWYVYVDRDTNRMFFLYYTV